MKKVLTALMVSGMVASASAADLSATCKEYFAEIDTFVAAVPAAQQEMMKQQYEASKKQITALPTAQQDMMCKQGLEQLKQSKAMLPK